MHFQFNVASAAATTTPTGQAGTELVSVLRLMLEAQREQVQLLRQQAASHDAGGRWRAFLDRWNDDFGGLPSACQKALPHLERAYMMLIAELASQLDENGEDTTGNEFALGEFLDRFGVRLHQLGAILSLVGPLAEIAASVEAKK